MVLSTVSLVPVAVAFVLALGAFGAWTAYLIRTDHRRAESLAATAAGPVAAPVVAMVTPVAAAQDWSQPHSLVAGPDAAPAGLCPVVRSGSFCTVVGASGITASGTEMVCSSDNGARPRWRRAVRELQRTA